MGNVLSSYPVGQMLDRSPPSRFPALPAPETALELLKHRGMTRDIARVSEELHWYYKQITNYTFNIAFNTDEEVKVPTTRELVWILIAAILKLLSGWEYSDTKPRNMLDVVILTGIIIQHNWLMITRIGSAFKTRRKFRSLKTILTQYTSSLEKLLLRFTGNDWTFTHPTYDHIKEQMKGVLKIFRTMKREEIQKYIPAEISMTPEDVLCCILGLDSVSSERLRYVRKDIRDHESDQYWIERLVHDNYHCLSESQPQSKQDVLIACGLTENRSKWICEWLDLNEFSEQQPLYYWLERYIEDSFAYDILLNQTPRYPYQQIVDKELVHEIETDGRIYERDETETSPEKWPVCYINVSNNNKSNILKELKEKLREDDEYVMWFHGTCHKSAEDIIENGINLGKGKEKQDFSHSSGFYLTTDVVDAAEWAQRSRFTPRSAIVAFRISKGLLQRFQKLDLNADQAMWTDVIRFNRHGRNRAHRPSTISVKQIKEVDYIEGPMCINASESCSRNFQPKGFNRQNPQTCILKPDMAEQLGDIRNINYVIFF